MMTMPDANTLTEMQTDKIAFLQIHIILVSRFLYEEDLKT